MAWGTWLLWATGNGHRGANGLGVLANEKLSQSGRSPGSTTTSNRRRSDAVPLAGVEHEVQQDALAPVMGR
jgi:hypothetical protein